MYKDVFTQDKKTPVNHVLAEQICQEVLAMCDGKWEEYALRLNNLLDINVEFLKLQRLLNKTGSYLYTTFEEVEREVFKNKKNGALEGVDYLWGVIFSHIFWVTHHRLFNFFIEEFSGKAAQEGKCLEAPTGSGIFLTHFLYQNPKWKGVTVDLSDTAIEFAKKFAEINGLTPQVEQVKMNIFELERAEKFNRIICVEFIEHVEDPVGIYKKLASQLADGGKIFLTTVAWAAFIDHIYLYKNAEEIRAHIREAGLVIEKEYLQNIFPKDEGRLEDDKVALNYTAVLTK